METSEENQHPEPRAAWSSGVRLGSLFGLEVLVHWRVLAITAVAIALATPLSPIDIPGMLGVTPVEFVALGVPMMVGSIFAHELGHAVAAAALGLGARSVFVDVLQGHTVPKRLATRARDEVALSLAGPFVTLVIWIALGRLAGDLYAPLFTTGSALAITASFNLVLVTNFLPILPADGGRALAAALWAVTGDRARGTRIAGALGPVLVGVPVLGVAAYIGVVRDDPAWGIAIACSALWQLRGVVGRRFDAADQIAGLRVADIMCPGLRTTPRTLARAVVQDRLSRKHSPDLTRSAALDLPYVAISDEGEVLGMLSPGEVDRLALAHLRWDTVTVADVMTPMEHLVTVAPDMEAHTALVYMVERRLEALLVIEDGKPVGCITARRLMLAMEDGRAEDRGQAEYTPRIQREAPRPEGQLSLFEVPRDHDRTDAA